jgi:hypothetical protein
MSLIQADLVPGSGDQLITYDTETNLQWLNLTATANRSRNEVLAGFGGFTTTYGFRYATGNEVGNLFRHAGISKGMDEPPFLSSANDQRNHIGIEILQDLMNGKTFIPAPSGTSGGHVRTQGIHVNGNLWFRRFLSLSISNHVNSHTDVTPLIGSPNPSDHRSADTGSYLVKSSPSPIVASAGVRSKKKQRKSSKTARGRR